MYRSLASLVPNAADLLALEVEELAGVPRLTPRKRWRCGSGGQARFIEGVAMTFSSVSVIANALRLRTLSL